MLKNPLDHPVIGVFEDTYPVPDDQIAAEFDLLDRYARELPESVVLLHDALADVKRVSGIMIPIPRVLDLDGEQAGSNLFDEHGNFIGRPDWCRLTLGLGQSDLEVRDELPTATVQMLVGTYSLLGASVAVDGSWKDRQGFFRREATRQGIYLGSPVYVDEIFQLLHTDCQDGGYYTFSVSVYNEADRLATEP